MSVNQYDVRSLAGLDGDDPHSVVYNEWMCFFALLGHSRRHVTVLHAPHCWEPLILYLGHRSEVPEQVFECDVTDWRKMFESMTDKRQAVEIASACRPELVHALFLADEEWPCPLSLHCVRHGGMVIPITTNGSFFRPEIKEYMDVLVQYEPERDHAVICPCAADKPYPSSLHKRLREFISPRWELVCATGTLGLVPEGLWNRMPNYDAGVPGEQRVEELTAWYFAKHKYEEIIVYSDFYGPAIGRGLATAGTRADFALGRERRVSYENLFWLPHLLNLGRMTARYEDSQG